MLGVGGLCIGNVYVVGYNVGFEIWKGFVDLGFILNCVIVLMFVINLFNGMGNFEMDVCIVIVKGKMILDVMIGLVNVFVMFIVIY